MHGRIYSVRHSWYVYLLTRQHRRVVSAPQVVLIVPRALVCPDPTIQALTEQERDGMNLDTVRRISQVTNTHSNVTWHTNQVYSVKEKVRDPERKREPVAYPEIKQFLAESWNSQIVPDNHPLNQKDTRDPRDLLMHQDPK